MTVDLDAAATSASSQRTLGVARWTVGRWHDASNHTSMWLPVRRREHAS